MVLLPKVILLSQSHLEHPGIVTLMEAFRNRLRLARVLSLTLSRNPRLLPLVVNSTVLRRKRHLDYVSTVGSVGNKVPECLIVPSDGQDKDWKMFRVPVQLVSTVLSQVTQGQVSSTVVQKPQEVDPRFEGHCSVVTLIRPDHSRHIVRALRDTGALQSLVPKQTVPDCDYESTGKFRLILSVMGEIVSVPLGRVTLLSSHCSGSFLCGLATSLPSGIDVLLGNDLCHSLPAVDVAVVSRFQSAVAHREAELQPSLDPDPDFFSS